MKLKSLLFMLPMLPVLFSCNQSSSYVPFETSTSDSLVDKDIIISQVEASLSDLSEGLINNDAVAIFNIFSKTRKTNYVRNGYIYPSVEKAQEEYANWLKERNGKRKFTFKNKHYDLISDRTVLFTGVGELHEPTDDGDIKPWTIAYTILWLKEGNDWKAINMHISWN